MKIFAVNKRKERYHKKENKFMILNEKSKEKGKKNKKQTIRERKI